MSSSELVEVRFAGKRPRSDSFSSVVVMPHKTYEKRASARGYIKKRSYKRLTLRTQLNRAQNAIHRMVRSKMAVAGGF